MKPGAALKLRLVSNQDVAQAVIEAVAAARADDHSPAAAVTQDLARITRATGLRGHDLTGFLAALDLCECGTGSRFSHHERVIHAIAKVIEDNATDLVAVLRQRMRELMLPERHRDTITLETVLSWLVSRIALAYSHVRLRFPPSAILLRGTRPHDSSQP